MRPDGLSAYLAANAEEALYVLGQHPEIQLILTEIGLCGMNGHDLVAKARRRRADLKAIFVTGYDRTGTASETPAGAVTRCIDKPFEPQKLIATVNAVMSAVAPASRGGRLAGLEPIG